MHGLAARARVRGFEGSNEELSHSPEALAALLADRVGGEQSFTRVPDGIAFTGEYVSRRSRSHLLALAPLLETPPFVLRELSDDAARQLKYDLGEDAELE
ncbi:MAG TPA: hypothetical protein VJR89_27665 [Polyangiales bacterium]|nr:hypothetical protein [Polyangiales bacterium]